MAGSVESRPVKIGVVNFPGSNCFDDAMRWFLRFGHQPIEFWHGDRKFEKVDRLFLPGGFANGDRVFDKPTDRVFRIDPGVQALKSPVMETVGAMIRDGVPTLGVCNGFQIAVHGGYLRGSLVRNEADRFHCDDVDVQVTSPFFGDDSMVGKTYSIQVAHGYGNYQVSPEELAELEANDQIWLRYSGSNPNGSVANIAGVCNRERTLFAMMPHPERMGKEVQAAFLNAFINL